MEITKKDVDKVILYLETHTWVNKTPKELNECCLVTAISSVSPSKVVSLLSAIHIYLDDIYAHGRYIAYKGIPGWNDSQQSVNDVITMLEQFKETLDK